jgi:hypothetical protein
MYPPSSNTFSSVSPTIPVSVPVAPIHDPSPNDYFAQDPYSPQAYGHVPGSSSYNPPTQQSYAPYDPFGAQAPTHNPVTAFNPDTYNATAAMVGAPSRSPYTSPYDAPRSPVQQPGRSYTLGGGGYGASTVPSPPINDPHGDSYYGQYQGHSNTSSPAVSRSPAIDTYVAGAPSNTSPVKGPRGQRNSIVVMAPPSQYDDSPPTYEAGLSGAPGQLGRKN